MGPMRIIKCFTVNGACLSVSLHEFLVNNLLFVCATINSEATVASHGFSDALSVDLPVLLRLALVSVVVEHPHRRGELGHDAQLDVVDAEAAEVEEHHGDEGQNIVRWAEHAPRHLHEHGHHGAHAYESTSLELEQGGTICRCALCKEADRPIPEILVLYLSLSLFDLFDCSFPAFLIGSSVNEDTLETASTGPKDGHVRDVGLGCEAGMHRRKD